MIFAIKRFETHDGDGIRTTVFFKGCPLRCKWCHNPESFRSDAEIGFNEELCVSCGRCTSVCSANLLEGGKHIFNRKECNLCSGCVDICPKECYTLYGDTRSASEIAEELMSDELFFIGSGGGVTFSGGEPLMQVDFCVEIAKILKERNINIAVDTCGYVDRLAFDKILPYADSFLYDIKAINAEVHKACTGRTNDIILENLQYIDKMGKKIEIRIPYVPEFNSGELCDIAKFISDLKSVDLVRILPYHKYAEAKYLSLGLKNALPDRIPTEAEMEEARILVAKISGKHVA